MKKICFFAFLSTVAFSCNRHAAPEMYLIPANFIGKVNILFNKSHGAPKEYENGRRVYRIPSNGILVSQFEIRDGIEDRRYYSVDEAGKRTPLEIFRYEYVEGRTKWMVSDKSKKGIFLDGITGQYGNTGDPRAAQFEAFIVSNYIGLDSFFTKEYRKSFDDKIDSITGLRLNL